MIKQLFEQFDSMFVRTSINVLWRKSSVQAFFLLIKNYVINVLVGINN